MHFDIKDDHWYEYKVTENIDLKSNRTGTYNVGIWEYPAGDYPWDNVHTGLTKAEANKKAKELANMELERRKKVGISLQNPHIKKKG